MIPKPSMLHAWVVRECVWTSPATINRRTAFGAVSGAANFGLVPQPVTRQAQQRHARAYAEWLCHWHGVTACGPSRDGQDWTGEVEFEIFSSYPLDEVLLPIAYLLDTGGTSNTGGEFGFRLEVKLKPRFASLQEAESALFPDRNESNTGRASSVIDSAGRQGTYHFELADERELRGVLCFTAPHARSLAAAMRAMRWRILAPWTFKPAGEEHPSLPGLRELLRGQPLVWRWLEYGVEIDAPSAADAIQPNEAKWRGGGHVSAGCSTLEELLARFGSYAIDPVVSIAKGIPSLQLRFVPDSSV